MKQRNGCMIFSYPISLKPLVHAGVQTLMAWNRWWEPVWED